MVFIICIILLQKLIYNLFYINMYVKGTYVFLGRIIYVEMKSFCKNIFSSHNKNILKINQKVILK